MISLLLSSSILFVGTQGVEVDGCSLMVSAKENLVAQHLAGNWTYHTKLTTHIYPLDSEKEVEPLNQIVLHIQDDSSVLKFVPEKDCSELMTSNTEIFMAGYFNINHVSRNSRHIFILTSENGSPVMKYWMPAGIVTYQVMMAPAQQRKNDMLFLGEEDLKRPFGALVRPGADSLCM